MKRGQTKSTKKVPSVTLSLEMLYDMLAIYVPVSHSGFWSQVSEAMLEAYENGQSEEENAMGQCCESNG